MLASTDIAITSNTRLVPQSFGKVVWLIRWLLANSGLSVVTEFNVSNEPYFVPASSLWWTHRPCCLNRSRWIVRLQCFFPYTLSSGETSAQLMSIGRTAS